jgi:hypothetical protein
MMSFYVPFSNWLYNMTGLIMVLRPESSKAGLKLKHNNLTQLLLFDGLLSINILNYFNACNFSLNILHIFYCVFM